MGVKCVVLVGTLVMGLLASDSAIEMYLRYLGRGVDSSNAIKAKTYDLESVKATKQGALVGYLPTADLIGSYGRNFYDSSGPAPYNEGVLTLRGDVPLLDMPQIAEMKAKRASYGSAEANLTDQIQQQIRFLALTWGASWQAQELLKLSLERKTITKAHLEGTQKRVAAGELTKTDVFQADSRYRMVASGYEQAMYTNYATKVSFEKAFKVSPPDTLWIPQFKEDSKYELTGEHPLLLADSLELRALKTSVHSQWYERLPRISFFASADRTWDDPEYTPTKRPNAYDDIEFGLRAVLPLVRSGGTITSYNVNKSLYNATLEQSSLNKDRVSELCAHSDSAVVVAQEVYMRSLEYDSLALEALKGIQSEFKAGMRSSQDVLLAQNDYFIAGERRIEAQYKLYSAHIERFYAYGVLTLNLLASNITTVGVERAITK